AAAARGRRRPARRSLDRSRCRGGPARAAAARTGRCGHEACRRARGRARQESTRANERAAAAELERARLGGEGQIRMLHVEEPEREQVEREARELTEEAERLAVLAAEAGEAARLAAADNGARRAAVLDADLVRRV